MPMTLQDRTIALLVAAGFPAKVIDPQTIAFWIARGKSPEQIAQEIYDVQAKES